MDAILELKKFFAEYPTLLELGKQLGNAQGHEKLRDFIDKHHPDIILIQETHLGRGDTIQVPNFTTYRNDRPYAREAAQQSLKSSLSHHHTPTPGTAEATSVTLTPPNGNPLPITSIYVSPTTSYQHLHTDLETIFGLGQVSIVYGDYNAHHTHWGGQLKINQRGVIIKNLIDNTNTQILAPSTPTRFGYNSTSVIDFALTRNLLWHSQVESIAETSSDHNPILISFDTNTRFGFQKRNISTDWELFRELLSPTHYSFKPITARTREDVETQVADLTNTILHTHALFYTNCAEKLTFQNKIWEDDLRSLDPDDGSLWNMSKELRSKKTPVYALKSRAGIANTDSETPEVLACSLESQFQENNIINPSDYLTRSLKAIF
ncbi:RNA-directed DNA polymerase from mobile element jockey [Trichonephila clavipes]|nr:RNA-directed DNA polymerase from mobile element jockey [Trichonephila clavipes]